MLIAFDYLENAIMFTETDKNGLETKNDFNYLEWKTFRVPKRGQIF